MLSHTAECLRSNYYCNFSRKSKDFDHGRLERTWDSYNRQVFVTKVSLGDSNDRQQPKMVSDTGILTPLKLWGPPLKFQWQSRRSAIYDHRDLEERVDKWLRQRPITGNGNVDALGANLAIACRRCRSHFSFITRATLCYVFATATCLSVCLSVCHTPVLCLTERKQDREMYTIW